MDESIFAGAFGISDDEAVGSFYEIVSIFNKKFAPFFASNPGWSFALDPDGKSFCVFFSEYLGFRGVVVTKSFIVTKRKSFRININGRGNKMIIPGVTDPCTIKIWKDFSIIIHTLSDANVNELFDNESLLIECRQSLGFVTFSEDRDKERTKNLIVDQLSNLLKNPSQRRYSADTMLTAYQVKNISTSSYHVLRKFFSLPTLESLRMLTNNFNSMDSENYFKAGAIRLSEVERTVTLSCDEMYLKEETQYKNGKIHGFAEVSRDGDKTARARTVAIFHIESIFGKTKDAVRLVPIAQSDARCMHLITIEVMNFLSRCGWRVAAFATDNNRLNQAVKLKLTGSPGGVLRESFLHPDDKGGVVFDMFDAVHCMKNLRNCQQNLKDQNKTFMVPRWSSTYDENDTELVPAEFKQVRDLFRSQSSGVLISAHKLTYKACYTSAFDKQKVYLADQVFHPSTIAALRAVGTELANNCAEVLWLFRSWWEIFNIKSVFVGDRMLMPFKKPFYRDTWRGDSRWSFLKQFVVWLDKWNQNPASKDHRLTNDTYQAVRQSCIVLPKLVEYLFETNPAAKYFLTAKIQTDQLERFIGNVRKFGGNNYRQSFLQVCEGAKKSWDRKVIKWKLLEQDFSVEEIENQVHMFAENQSKIEIDISAFENILGEDFGDGQHVDMDAVNHVAGACANAVQRKVFKGNKCESCIQFLTSGNKGDIDGSIYQANIQRGGLLVPSEFARTSTHYAMTLVLELATNPTCSNNFATAKNQKKIIEALLHVVIDPFCDELECEECEAPFTWHVKVFLSSLSNTILVGLSKLLNRKMELEHEKLRMEKENKLKNKRMKSAETSQVIEASQVIKHKDLSFVILNIKPFLY